MPAAKSSSPDKKSKPSTAAVASPIATTDQPQTLQVPAEQIYVRVKYRKSTFFVFVNTGDKVSTLYSRVLDILNPFKLQQLSQPSTKASAVVTQNPSTGGQLSNNNASSSSTSSTFEYKPHPSTGCAPFKVPHSIEEVRLFTSKTITTASGCPVSSKLSQHTTLLKDMDVFIGNTGIANDAIILMALRYSGGNSAASNTGDKWEPIDVPQPDPIQP